MTIMKITAFLLTSVCYLGSLSANPEVQPMLQQEPEELIVYNRILGKVNNKTISVMDVMKKMDLFLQKNYPHLANSKLARYQFYSAQWRDYLTQIIDTELMIADAEKLEVKIAEAEVREEMLNRFGPNMMPLFDTLGISYEEAKQMIHDEMIVQRMMWFRVNSKALSTVNSKDVKEAYKEFCAKNPEMQEWQYQVLSIRSADKLVGEALAARACELLHGSLDLTTLSEQLKTTSETATVSLSPDMQTDEKHISASHKEVLMSLEENSYSQPIAATSRADNSTVYRIFHLKKQTKKQVPTFEKMAEQIKEQLLQSAAGKENTQYIAKLRARLGYDEKYMMQQLPSDFQPFALK